MDPEAREIQASIISFSEQMELRMLDKKDEGFTGWDSPHEDEILNRMLAKVENLLRNNMRNEEYNKELVDIANFAMMLHRQRQ